MLGLHVSSIPQGSRGGACTSAHTRLKPGTLCRAVVCSWILLDKMLGDWDVACGNICCWKLLLRMSDTVCFSRAADFGQEDLVSLGAF